LSSGRHYVTECRVMLVTYDRAGTGEYTQVPDNTWSPAADRVYPHCSTDGVVQALSVTAGLCASGGTVDTETAVHGVH